MKRPSAGLGTAALCAFLYLYPFPYFEEMRSANELPRVYLTSAMVDEGTFAIDTGVRNHGRTADISPSGGHVYSNKAPGSSMVAIPAYLLLKGAGAVLGFEPTLAHKTWAFRLASGVIPTLLFLLLAWRFLARFVPDPSSRRMALCGYALGSMAMIYSILFFAHQLSAVCIASSWMIAVWVIEDDRDSRWLIAVGALAGMALLVDYQAAFAGIPIAVYLLYKLLRHPPRRWTGVGMAVAGAAVPVALLLFYHAQAFGSPLRTGYAASETFAHFHQRGFLGMDQFRLEALVGSTASPEHGLVFLCPMVLLAIPGLVLLWRRGERWTAGVCLSVMLIYLAFVSSLSFWRGGWSVGPRYITVMLPFALVPIAVAIAHVDRLGGAKQIAWRGLAVGLVVVSIVVYCASAVTFPHYPETFDNPLYELVFRLLGDGYAPYNAGWLVGLRGTASLVPYGLVVAGLILWLAMPARKRWPSALVGLIVAGLILTSYSLAPHGGKDAQTSYWRITTWMPSGPARDNTSP